MRKVAVAVSAALAMSTFLAPSASAAPDGCSAAFEQFNRYRLAGEGVSECNRGIQRLKLTCIGAITSLIYVTYGPYRGPNERSNAGCASPDYAIGAEVNWGA